MINPFSTPTVQESSITRIGKSVKPTIEAVDLGDLSAFMVATEKDDAVRPLGLECE